MEQGRWRREGGRGHGALNGRQSRWRGQGCRSLSGQKPDENWKETLRPPEVRLPGGGRARSRLHSGPARSARRPLPAPFLPLLTPPPPAAPRSTGAKLAPRRKIHTGGRVISPGHLMCHGPATRPSRFEQARIPSMELGTKGLTTLLLVSLLAEAAGGGFDTNPLLSSPRICSSGPGRAGRAPLQDAVRWFGVHLRKSPTP